MNHLETDFSNLNEWMKEHAQIIHQVNVEAGWWTDLATGQRKDRNIPEMLALVHSEISEAFDGLLSLDDKLPQYNGALVEIVDALIRLFDMVGGLNIDLKKVYINGEKLKKALEVGNFPSFDSDISVAHAYVSLILEAHRKGRIDALGHAYADAIVHLVTLFEITNHVVEGTSSLDEILEAKMAFNANRADHKVENRKLDDGKKF